MRIELKIAFLALALFSFSCTDRVEIVGIEPLPSKILTGTGEISSRIRLHHYIDSVLNYEYWESDYSNMPLQTESVAPDMYLSLLISGNSAIGGDSVHYISYGIDCQAPYGVQKLVAGDDSAVVPAFGSEETFFYIAQKDTLKAFFESSKGSWGLIEITGWSVAPSGSALPTVYNGEPLDSLDFRCSISYRWKIQENGTRHLY